MPVELPLHPNQVSVEDLVEIYRAFCTSFDIRVTPRDERFMRTRGIEDLHDGHLDYRPYMGAKFFGQKFGKSTQFHGYSFPEDTDWQGKDKRFQELVLQYLSKMPGH
ncbi:MAG: hypothetical protein WC613_05055 [Candidatus Aenigmatarchaeota archaeon]